MTDINLLRKILSNTQTIAVVGLSDKPHRASHTVAKYLQEHGFRVIPVNPKCEEILGEKSYASLEDIPGPVDMVDCFRRSEQMPELAHSAVAIKAKCLWMQLGIVNDEAKAIAEAGGLDVVMDRCTKIDHDALFGGLNATLE